MSSFRSPNLPALYVANQYESDWKKFARDLLSTLDNMSHNLVDILNGGISFSDNADVSMIFFTSSATPDATNTVAHTLGKVPTGYIVYGLDKAAIVYTGVGTWSKTQIFLKVNVASVAVKILVF